MNTLLTHLLRLFVVVSLSVLLTTQVHAAPQLTVRLDKSTPNSVLSGTVCMIQPAGNTGTEGRVTINFPSSFTISGNTANWSTTTSNLPSGASAWPGIGSSALSVSGNAVTFLSSDIPDTANYCFHFASSASRTGIAGLQEGSVTTRSSSGTFIFDQNFGVVIGNNDVSVTATVAAGPNSFQADILEGNNPDYFRQHESIEFIVQYGSYLTTQTQIIVQADWSLGTVGLDTTPSLEIVEYESGSARNAYNDTPPVIDLANRTITWSIALFPGNTQNERVAFKLKTTDIYKDREQVHFTVRARVFGPGVVTPDSSVTNSYLYNYVQQGRSGPTSTPTPQLTPRLTPSTQIPVPAFTRISLQEITARNAQFLVNTTADTTLQVRYGTSLSKLNQTLIDPTNKRSRIVKIPDLSPDTPYFLQFIATNQNGRSTRSNYYTFRTAKESDAPTIDRKSVVITSENVILLSNATKESQLVLPTNAIYDFQFSLESTRDIRSSYAQVRDASVLGVTTLISQAQASTDAVAMLETKRNVFNGRLKTAGQPGTYVVIARMSDTNGNLTEEKIADLRVIAPLTVMTDDATPVENARVFFARYNEAKRLYEPLSSVSYAARNPVFSDEQGIAHVILPQGKYQAEISTLGYDTKQVQFTLGSHTHEVFPSVTLVRKPFSLVNFALYITTTAGDVMQSTLGHLTNWSVSKRFYDLTNTVTFLIFVGMLAAVLVKKTRVPVASLPAYLHHSLRRRLTQDTQVLQGSVTDADTDHHLAGVIVYAIDSQGNMMAHTTTDSSGRFKLQLHKTPSELLLMKDSYHPVSMHTISPDELLAFAMTRHNESLLHQVRWYEKLLISLSVEGVLFILLVLQIVLLIVQGDSYSLVLVSMAVINLLLWLHAMKKHLGHPLITP
jgi:hypothetical protein